MLRNFLLILILSLTGFNAFSQAEIRNKKMSRVARFREGDDILFLEKSDSLPLSRDDVKRNMSLVRHRNRLYRTGYIVKILDSTFVINEYFNEPRKNRDTLSFDSISWLGRYKTGAGQKVLGGSLLLVSGIGLYHTIHDYRPEGDAIDRAFDFGIHTIGVTLGAIGSMAGAVLLASPVNQAFLLGKDYHLTSLKTLPKK